MFWALGCSSALWLLSKPAQAEEKIPALKKVPDRLAADVRERLSQRRQELEKELLDFQAAAGAFNARQAEDQSDAEYEALQTRRARYISSVKAFNQEVSEYESDVETPEGPTTEAEITRRLVEIGQAIPRIRQEIEKYQKQDLPGLTARFDEWLALDARQRHEMRARGVSLVEVVFLDSLRLAGERTGKLVQSDWDRIWAEFKESPLAKDDYQFLYRRLAQNAAATHKWQRADDFLKWAERAHEINVALPAARREECGRATIALLGLALHDPRAKILVAETDFLGAVGMAQATDYVARKEVDRILTMESEQLKTVTHLCAKMKSLVDERVALRKEQAKIHEKAASGQAEEKK